MTSNLGSQQLLEKMEHTRGQVTKEGILDLLEPIIHAHFRPEFINRLDEILPFLPLRKEDMEKIVIIQLNLLSKRLSDREISLTWDKKVVAHLAETGYDPFFGARPLKRLIQQEVVNMLSNGILDGSIPGKCHIELVMKDKSVTYQINV